MVGEATISHVEYLVLLSLFVAEGYSSIAGAGLSLSSAICAAQTTRTAAIARKIFGAELIIYLNISLIVVKVFRIGNGVLEEF